MSAMNDTDRTREQRGNGATSPFGGAQVAEAVRATGAARAVDGAPGATAARAAGATQDAHAVRAAVGEQVAEAARATGAARARHPLGALAVNERGDGFTCDGAPWFWLADTCWSAFSNIALDDWEYYLARRAEQGMNVLQINTLPQWDRCRPDLGIYPYASDDGTVFDWTAPNPQWWERAREMCRRAQAHGLRPALVLLWCNYVPGTWGSAIAQRLGAPCMPLQEVRAHVHRVVEELGAFDPVYVVSGDTDFSSEEAVRYYEEALDAICAEAPEQLRCMHINRANRTLPEQFLDRLDFYMFQPGHNYAAQDEAWRLPEDFRARYPKKPLVNAEPCYEQMGASRNVYWRFSARDCRASAWSSILSGASAGVTYGAHGVWNWQTAASDASALGEGFDAPYRWQECLQFAGAWDFGAIPEILERICVAAPLMPAQELLDDDREGIRVARAGSRIVAYLPHATRLRLRGCENAEQARVGAATQDGAAARLECSPTPQADGAGGADGAGAESSFGTCRAYALDLEQRRVAHLTAQLGADGRVVVPQHPFAHDALVVLEL